MLSILLSILILSVNCAYDCTVKYDLACCKENCPFCGNCVTKNLNASLSSSEYVDFKDNCCEEIILDSGRYCNETVAPCIIDQKLNNFQRIIHFFKSGKLQQVIPVSIGLGLIVLFYLYATFIFGTKRPPLKYKHIIGRLKEIQ